MENLLDQNIPTEVADFLIKEMEKYKKAVDVKYRKKVNELDNLLKENAQRVFEFSDRLIEESEARIREEYSAKLAARLEEKNSKIEELEEEIVSWKDELAERVNLFLTNAKEDVRTIVEEEFRVDAEELKSKHILEQIKDLVVTDQSKIVPIEEGKIERLEADIEALKERVAQKTKVNERLKAELHVAQLLESVPEADRDFYSEHLTGADTVYEVDERFERVKNAVRKTRSERLEEEYDHFSSRGNLNEVEDVEDYVRLDKDKIVTDRMKELSGR